MIPSSASTFLINSVGPKFILSCLAISMICAAIIFLFRKRRPTLTEKKLSEFKIKDGSKIPSQGQLPKREDNGRRAVDMMPMPPDFRKRRSEALSIAKQGHLKEAAVILQDLNLHREAIDLLERNSLLDEAAAILMQMNRPNRAAVLYERNKKFEKATIYFLKAKLIDDAKRCCKQIKEFNASVSTELAPLFADAGDNMSALRLLASAREKKKLIKLVREKSAYCELGKFLDYPAARRLLLDSLGNTDVESMLQNIPVDGPPPLQRALTWISEGKRAEFLLPVFKFIGDNRAVASGFIEKLDPAICSKLAEHIEQSSISEMNQKRQHLEWIARAFHDAALMAPAAKIYEKINQNILAGKCWAIAGDAQRALRHLTGDQGDMTLAADYQRELDRMGRITTDQNPLAQHEIDAISRLFGRVDPDTEKNRSLSPFSIAS